MLRDGPTENNDRKSDGIPLFRKRQRAFTRVDRLADSFWGHTFEDEPCTWPITMFGITILTWGRPPSAVQRSEAPLIRRLENKVSPAPKGRQTTALGVQNNDAHVGTAALGRPAERSSAHTASSIK